LTLQCNGRSETELGAKTVFDMASGLSGKIPVDLNPATANFGVAIFIKTSAISFEN
jgi:hypothetical protein